MHRYICRCAGTQSSVKFPVIIGFFGSFNIRHPPSGDPARVDQAPTCVPAVLTHSSDLLIQIHLEALSAASVIDLIALLFAAPVMLSRVKLLHKERANMPPSNLNGFTVSPPTPPPALLYELLILKLLALIGLFHTVPPRDCQFQQENLLRQSRCQHHILS